MKKANISIQIIIFIILALIVILVLGWKLSDNYKIWQQTNSCEAQGATCSPTKCNGIQLTFDCPDDQVCCSNSEGDK